MTSCPPGPCCGADAELDPRVVLQLAHRARRARTEVDAQHLRRPLVAAQHLQKGLAVT
ncbi:hypothetical protein [Aeromicrobium sp. UC242_57]|uniref:hypothetical protein n=1 Tax=Aeromicrobium sp. UC242_57 TaxID=3374624 RepID=UPI0037B275A9